MGEYPRPQGRRKVAYTLEPHLEDSVHEARTMLYVGQPTDDLGDPDGGGGGYGRGPSLHWAQEDHRLCIVTLLGTQSRVEKCRNWNFRESPRPRSTQ